MAFFLFFAVRASSAHEPLLLWHGLLHYKDSQFIIKDPNFYLQDFPESPEQELKKTLEFITHSKGHAQSYACRFPARYKLVLKHFYPDPGHEYEKLLLGCQDYQEFLYKVPAENLYLVFAAENISSPLSMMGHVLIMLEGEDSSSVKRQHAFSYFAVINSMNPVSLISESLFTGQEGRFGLSPYHQALLNYTDYEGRSVWQYRLNLSHEEKHLIRDHIFELRNIKPDYFFTKYNCATFTYDLLSITNPQLNERRNNHLWITPRDLVKELVSENSFTSQTMYINPIQAMKVSKWHVSDETKMLKHEDFENPAKIERIAKKSKYDEVYIRNLNEYFYNKNLISSQTYQEIKKITENNLIKIDLLPKPEKAPYDTQISVGITRSSNQQRISLSFMPASHRLLDSSEGFFTENALELGDIEISLNNDSIQLDRFTLYKVSNINTIDPHVKNLSWGWKIALDRDEPIRQTKSLGLNSEIGMGGAFDINAKLVVYNLNYIGTYLTGEYDYIYVRPEIGAIKNINKNLKININSSLILNSKESSFINYFGVSARLKKDLSITTELTRIQSNFAATDQIKIKLVKFF